MNRNRPPLTAFNVGVLSVSQPLHVKERLELAADAAGIGTWAYDPAEDRLDWDERCKALFGLSPHAPVSYESAFLAGLHPDDRDRTHRAVQEALDTGECFDIEYRTVGLEDGLERWVAAAGKTVQVRRGVRRFMGAVWDIGPRKLAERRLAILNSTSAAVAAERDLETIVQMITDAGVELSNAEFGAFFYNVMDKDGESYTLYALSGASREAFAGFPMPRNTLLFTPTFSGAAVLRADDITKDARFGLNLPYRGMPEGHLPVRSYLALPAISRTGAVLGGLFFGHSESGRFDAESEKLLQGIAAHAAVAIDNVRLYADALAAKADLEKGARSASEQFRVLVEGVVDYAIYMLDVDGRVSTWNAGAQRIKGYSAEEVIGQHFSRFYTSADRQAGEPWRLLREAAERGKVEAEGQRVRKDGTTFFASVVIDALRNDAGELIGFAKITRDITSQKAAAEELERTREALFHAQKMESIGQLTGGIAHDFNNMLSGIIAGIRMLQRRLQEGRRQDAEKYAALVADSAQRAVTLTSRLLSFGRRQTLDVTSIDAAAALRAVELILRTTMGENISVKVDITGHEQLMALADRHQLESALINLCINARDAMPIGGTLTLSASRRIMEASGTLAAGPYIAIEVRDTGTGIPPDVLDRVFEPFFTTKPIGAGTGLGLSMVYGFARQVGGNVVIESEADKGTRVRLFLPEAPAGASRESKSRHEPPPGQGQVVLLVEDDPQLRTLLADFLQDIGYAVMQSADADAAMSLLDQSGRLDLLISDVGLPGLNGRQLADIARRHRRDLPVLFLTGYAAQARIKSDFLEHGMDLMMKPVDLDALAEKITGMIGHKRR